MRASSPRIIAAAVAAGALLALAGCADSATEQPAGPAPASPSAGPSTGPSAEPSAEPSADPSDPANAGPGGTDPGNAESGDTDSDSTDSGNKDPGSSDPNGTQSSPVALPHGFFSPAVAGDPAFSDGDVQGILPERIRVGMHEDFERVVIDFSATEHTKASGNIELWLERVKQARADGSGKVIEMDGDAIVAVSIPGTAPRMESPLPQPKLPKAGIVSDIAYTGFEGGATLYVAVADDGASYRLTQLTDPYRVVLDIKPAKATTTT